MRHQSADLVRVLEAAYEMDLPEDAWIRGLIEAVRPCAEDGLGMAAYLYDFSVRPFMLRCFTHDSPVDERGLSMLFDQSNDDYVRRSWMTPPVGTASEVPGFDTHPGVLDVFHPAGIRDIFVLNALDPIGIGCWIGAPLRAVRQLAPADRERWSRIAAHVRAALRLRLRLAQTPPAEVNDGGDRPGAKQAVFTPDGKLQHITVDAEGSRATLREAVLAIERARGPLRRDPDRALPSWKALVQARWTLVDELTVGGQRYVLARTNELSSVGFESLTPRERQVAACIAMGNTNKEAAYELGLSHSTVRVLVARACAKLGAKSRTQLIALYRRSELA